MTSAGKPAAMKIAAWGADTCAMPRAAASGLAAVSLPRGIDSAEMSGELANSACSIRVMGIR